jgi:Ca2+-binding RTX toxin-like protein
MNNNDLIRASLLATVEISNVPTDGADNLIGTIGSDNIYALGGDDTINSGLGIDFVNGGRTLGGTGDNDLLVVDYSSNNYIGNSAGIVSNVSFLGQRRYYYGSFLAVNNTNGSFDQVTFTDIERFQITGTAANDSISTGDGNDTLNGGGGNDTLKSYGGNDVINGGDGDDYIEAGGLGYYTTGTSSLSTFNTIDGGAGFDILYEAYFATSATNLVFNDAGTTIFIGNSSISNIEGFRFLTTGSANDSIIFTKQSLNVINTGSGDDTINAGLGRDYVAGGDGNDLLIVDYSSNSYVGSSPASGITSYIGSNTPGNNSYFSAYNSNSTESDKYDRVEFNEIERFQITGTSANDVIRTREGNDTLNGGDGDDYFNSGLGDDTVIGGNGNDILESSGDSIGLDTFAGGSGNDIYGVYNSATTIVENFDEGSDSVWTEVNYNLAANLEHLYLVGDTTGTGNAGDNIIYGYGVGNNTMNGGEGRDSLYGGEGVDTLNGGLGNDYLNGGNDADVISGGSGSDTFVFWFGQSTYLATDKITDFSIGSDKISLFAPSGIAASLPSSFYRANNNSTATSLQALAQSVYTDADGAQTGNQSLATGGAATVVSTGAGIAGTYLIIDDGVSGLSTNDVIINITGISGALPNFGTNSIGLFFP